MDLALRYKADVCVLKILSSCESGTFVFALSNFYCDYNGLHISDCISIYYKKMFLALEK